MYSDLFRNSRGTTWLSLPEWIFFSYIQKLGKNIDPLASKDAQHTQDENDIRNYYKKEIQLKKSVWVPKF